jgi:hypothetical protein
MEETAILHFEVDQAGAEQKLEKIEGLILDNRKAQQELTKAYKAGTITQQEYVKENLRLQQNIKKEQDQKKTLLRTINTESNSRDALKLKVSQLTKEYDSLNIKTAQGAKRADELEKELAQLNNQLTKGDKAAGLFKNQIGNYPEQFANAAKNINVAGVSVGDLTGRLASFANPATAAVGIITALGSAYAKSTIGAKDLEFAQNRLSSAFTILNNQLAEFISSGEDGEGIFSRLTDSFLDTYLPGVSTISEIAARNIELLEDLGREESQIRASISDRVEENQELLELIADDQQSFNDRLAAADTIEKNLIQNKKDILAVLNEQLKALEFQLALDKENENLQDLVIDKKREISKESATQEKQITRINKQQDDLNKRLSEELEKRRKIAEAEQQLFEFEVREANAPDISLANDPRAASATASNPIVQQSKERQEQYIAELKTVEFTEKRKQEFWMQSAEIQQQINEQSFRAAIDVAAGLAGLFEEQTLAYKVFASAETVLSTYSAATKAYEAAFTPPTVASPALGAVYAGLAVANGLANLAKINGVQFADGGWTGPGAKYDVAGVVHADEYVVPKSVNNMPQAQPHLAALERMRGGYADGGFVTNTNIATAQQSMIISNALRNMPVPEVSVKEITTKQKRIRVRETISTLSP